MTVDVEEHFQVSGFEDVVSRDDWDGLPSRVVDNTVRILDLFDELEIQATFFVLGWIAERYPALVRRIADRGHEIGSHGHSHRLVYDQTPEDFEAETRRSRAVLQDASGQEIAGYRSASFSIRRTNLWALDVLAEAGFTYDSSLFPVVHDRYGIPGAPRHIHRLRTPRGHSLIEVPPSTVSVAGSNLPVAGGGYLRIYPLAVNRWAMRRLNRDESMPAIVYIHPWELDPDQPRIRGRASSRLRHYLGLRSTCRKLRALAAEFRFTTMQQVIAASATASGDVVTVEYDLEAAV